MDMSTNATDGLPKQFVTSLRVLFDILDEERTGYVSLRDIESRWHEDGVSGLPSGVIETLRKVAPRNGKLTFDNFVTGLKLSLLKKTNSDQGPSKREPPAYIGPKPGSGINLNRRTNVPADYVNIGPLENNAPYTNDNQKDYRMQPKMGSQVIVSGNMAAVKPNNVLQSQNIELRNQIYTRDQLQQASAKSQNQVDQGIPAHSNKSADTHYHRPPRYNEAQRHHSVDGVVPRNDQPRPSRSQRPKSAHMDYARPPNSKPTRPVSSGMERPERPPPYRKPKEVSEEAPVLPPKNMNSRIMNELKNWHKEHHFTPTSQRQHMHPRVSDTKSTDKNAIYVNIDQIRKHEFSQSQVPGTSEVVQQGTRVLSGQSQVADGVQQGTRRPPKRQNSRRHTLSSGIDYNVIRRMKQLELEKDVLLQGLEVVDRAREWYLEQIAAVTEKQTFAERTSCSDVTLQSHQEKMDFVRSRITDVNMNLKTLMETSKSGFPAHMNLAIRSSVLPEDKSTKWLKEQNKQLTQEVGDKSEKITQLEKEKATLIRDLFEARSKHKSNYDDTTFM